MRLKLEDDNIENYFIDIAYLIVPKSFKQYKLMTITGVDNINKNSYIWCLILLKYEDSISLSKIFKYMNEIFKFNPNVVHIDYYASLRKFLLASNLFKTKPIIIHCFFHFIQTIVKHMKFYGIIKNKITKYSFEIIKNIL